MRVHLAIVSDQLLPTVIPCLMDRPDRVVLVASRPMGGNARRLKTLLETEGFAVEERDRAPDGGMPDIRAYATALVQELDAAWPGAELVFNATGGTKLMALGFVEVFRERADRIIYTDTAHGRVEVIHDRHTAAPKPEPMRDVLDVPRYLAVQGFRYEGDGSRDEALRARLAGRRPASQYLAEHAAQLEGFIGALNGLASQAVERDVLARPVQRFRDVPRGRWLEALKTLQRGRVLHWSGQAEIEFPDAEAARFCGGGWLEEYAYAVAKDVGLYDVRFKVRGIWEGAERIGNEFDILACDRNRLLFIECKTLRWNEDEKGNDNDLAYKIESLGKDVRGLFGASWLVTARKPTRVLEARARQAKFRLIGPHELRYLQDRLQAWKGGRSG